MTIILFKIWPTNRFSKTNSYNFHFHKNDVTCLFVQMAYYCPLHHVPVPLHKQADVKTGQHWPRCGIGCPWASKNGVKSSNSCRMTTTLTPSSLHGGGIASNITDLPTWFWIIIQFSMMLPVLQNTGYLNPGTPFRWVKSSIDFLKNQKSSVRLQRVTESLIHQNQLAWPSTCKGWYGIRFWLRNTIKLISIHRTLYCCTSWKVTLVGSHFTHAADSSMHQSRERS